MTPSKRIRDAFEDCLARVMQGESIEDSVRRYPKQAGELRDLLKTAVAARKAAAVEPTPEFKERSRRELLAAMQQEVSREYERKRRGAWAWRPRLAFTAVGVAVMAALGSGTVLASNNSMPGQPLYVVKHAAEQARLAVTISPEAKAEIYADLAQRRVDEIVYLANNGDAEKLDATTEALNSCLVQISELSGGVPENAVLSSRNTEPEAAPPAATGGIRVFAAPEPSATPAPGTAAPTTAVPPQTTRITPSTPAGSTQPASMPPDITATTPYNQLTGPTTDAKVAASGAGPSAADSTADNSSTAYGAAAGSNTTASNAKLSNNATSILKLKAKVCYQAVEYPSKLREALANAKPEVRIALLKAIAVSQTGYERILQSLEDKP